jgi:hypothetical protein
VDLSTSLFSEVPFEPRRGGGGGCICLLAYLPRCCVVRGRGARSRCGARARHVGLAAKRPNSTNQHAHRIALRLCSAVPAEPRATSLRPSQRGKTYPRNCSGRQRRKCGRHCEPPHHSRGSAFFTCWEWCFGPRAPNTALGDGKSCLAQCYPLGPKARAAKKTNATWDRTNPQQPDAGLGW